MSNNTNTDSNPASQPTEAPPWIAGNQPEPGPDAGGPVNQEGRRSKSLDGRPSPKLRRH